MHTCPLSWLCRYLFPWQWFTVNTVWRTRKVFNWYPVNLFHGYFVPSVSHFVLSKSHFVPKYSLFVPRGKLSKCTPNPNSGRKTMSGKLLEERPCLWDVYFCKDYHVLEKREWADEDILLKYPFFLLRLIQCLVFLWLYHPPLPTFQANQERLNTSSQSIDFTPFFRQTNMMNVCFLKILDRFWTQTSLTQVLNPTCCIYLATSSNNVQHHSTMLDLLAGP